jgi:transposase
MSALVDGVRTALSPQVVPWEAYTGRPAIAPEQWRRALLRPALDTMRRARLLREQRDDHRRWRWLVGLNRDDPIEDASTFSKPCERLLAADIAHACGAQILAQARARHLLSEAPFTIGRRTTRHPGYVGSQRQRQGVNASFG